MTEPLKRPPGADPAAEPAGRWPLWKSAVFVVGVWTAVGLWSANEQFLAAWARGQPVPSPRLPIVLTLYEVWLWAAFTPLFVWVARRFPLQRGRLGGALGMYSAVAMGTHVLDVALDRLTFPVLTGQAAPPFIAWLLSQANVNLVSTGGVIAITLALDYYRAFRSGEVQAARLEAQLVQAQLQVLRAQLHPHFLFNTLHAISALMHRDVEAADRMVARLSDLLRMSVDAATSQEVSLGQELEFLRGYLDIEQTRFSDRLQVEVEVETGLHDAMVPHLLLQPLVENAVRHGIAPRARGGRIEIRVTRDNGVLRVSVCDDGLGLTRREGDLREGVGLRATRARLQQLYGAAQRLDLAERRGGGVEVTLTLPYRTPGTRP